jgi:hypothetical protein
MVATEHSGSVNLYLLTPAKIAQKRDI